MPTPADQVWHFKKIVRREIPQSPPSAVSASLDELSCQGFAIQLTDMTGNSSIIISGMLAVCFSSRILVNTEFSG